MRDLGLPAHILATIYARRLEVNVSPELFAEYVHVLNRPRLKIPAPKVDQLLNWYRAHARWVQAPEAINICSDPSDDMVLACAIRGQVDFLVTGNTTDFPQQWEKISVVTPRQFVGEPRCKAIFASPL